MTQIPTYIYVYIYIDIVYIYSIGLNHEITFLLEPYRDPVVVWKVRNLPGSSSCSEAGERRVADGVSLACGTGAPKKNPRVSPLKTRFEAGDFFIFLEVAAKFTLDGCQHHSPSELCNRNNTLALLGFVGIPGEQGSFPRPTVI